MKEEDAGEYQIELTNRAGDKKCAAALTVHCKFPIVISKWFYQDKQIMVPEDDHTGMLSLERVMSGYTIHLFEVFTPMIELQESDTVEIQWTILKK